MIRPPAVAGRFYPDDPRQLREMVGSLLSTSTNETIRAMACMVPHAGYKYSGRVAGEVFRRIVIPDRIILVGPRHFPRGAAAAILSEGSWQTPLGLAAIDTQLAERISRSCSLLREDATAHSAEHSLEVQLPFLQRLSPSLAFVPIVIGALQYEDLEFLGHSLADIIRSEPDPILLVASSDMNHYESDEITRVKDRKAIDCMVALEPRNLFNTVRDENISMCGYGSAVVMLAAMRNLGACKAELVSYATSGDVNGDFQEVVGYGGIIIT